MASNIRVSFILPSSSSSENFVNFGARERDLKKEKKKKKRCRSVVVVVFADKSAAKTNVLCALFSSR